MGKLKYKLPVLMIILLIIITAFNISFAQKTKSIKGNTTIKLNGFSIVSPSGDDWKYYKTPDNNAVQFLMTSSNFLNGKENFTFLMVFKDSMLSDIANTEREYAGQFLEENLNGFETREKMKSVTRNRNYDTTISGKKFFALSFKADDHTVAIPPEYADNLYLIYFPDDFKTSRIFYQFIIEGYYNLPLGKKKSNKADLKPIFRLINSFKKDDSVILEKIE